MITSHIIFNARNYIYSSKCNLYEIDYITQEVFVKLIVEQHSTRALHSEKKETLIHAYVHKLRFMFTSFYI